MRISTRKKAFTLVELIVTCVILGILFVVLLANIDFSTDTAREAGLKSALQSYEHACVSVGMEYGGFTNDPNELVKQLNKRLDSEMHFKASAGKIYTDYVDPWGNTFEIVYTEPINAMGEIRFTSAGPDGLFNTVDDYILVTRYDTNKAEVVVERPVNDPDHMHIFDKKVASGQYIAAPATCISPRQYYYSCECGAAGNLAFADGDVDATAHNLTKQQYVSFDKNQHKVQNWCRDCNQMISELFENHSLTADGNQCQYCWIEGGVHEHIYNLAESTDKFKKSSATCTEPAYYYYSCSCGDRGTEIFAYGSSLGHIEVSVGSANIHSKCYTCGEVLKDASGHMLQETVMITATCALPGQMQVMCACGYSYVKEIPATGHVTSGQLSCKSDVVCQVCGALIQAKEQHKPIDGGTYGIHKQCQVCGDVLQGFEHHQYVTQVVNGTCNTLGYVKKICACGYSYNETQAMEYDYSRHGEGARELLANTLPNGTNKNHTICSICGHAWTVNGLPTTHKLVEDTSASYDATCNAAGQKVSICIEMLNGQQCTYKEVEVIAKKAHATVRHAAVAPKCTTTGQETYYSCSTCTKYFSDINAEREISKDSWILPANGHAETSLPAKDATCTNTGLKAGKQCVTCGVVTVPQETVAALGHRTANGSACSSGKCIRCGTQLTGNGSHVYEYKSTADVCGRCKNCGQTTNHTLSWQELTSTRTCLKKGTSRYTCTNAKCSYTFDHAYNASTCADNCSLCGSSAKAPNSHEQSKTYGGTLNNHEYYPCCGKVVSTTHSNTTRLSFTVGNCVDPGVTYYQCVCGYKQNASDNTGVKGVTVPGNHKSSTPGHELGMNVCTYCTACKTIVQQNHAYQGGVFVVKQPQCTDPGTKGQRCEDCNYLNEWANTDAYDVQEAQYHSGQVVYGKTVGLTAHTVYNCCKTLTKDNHTYVLDSYSSNNCASTLQLYATVKCADTKCNHQIRVNTKDVTVTPNQAANCMFAARGSFLISWDTNEETSGITFITSLCTNACLHVSNGSINPYNHFNGGGNIEYGPTSALPEAHERCEHCKGMINSNHTFSSTAQWSCTGVRAGASLSFIITCTNANCGYSKTVSAGSTNTPSGITEPGCTSSGSTRHTIAVSTINYEYMKNDGTIDYKEVVKGQSYGCDSHTLAATGHNITEVSGNGRSQAQVKANGGKCYDLWDFTLVCSNTKCSWTNNQFYASGSYCAGTWHSYFKQTKTQSSNTTSATCQLGAANYYTYTYTLTSNPALTITGTCECKDNPSGCLHRGPKGGHTFAALTSGGTADIHGKCIYTSQGCTETTSAHSYSSSTMTFNCGALTVTYPPSSQRTGVLKQTCSCGYIKTTSVNLTSSSSVSSTTCNAPISFRHSYNGNVCGGHKYYGSHTSGGWTTVSGSTTSNLKRKHSCGLYCTHRWKTTGLKTVCLNCDALITGSLGGGGIQETLK